MEYLSLVVKIISIMNSNNILLFLTYYNDLLYYDFLKIVYMNKKSNTLKINVEISENSAYQLKMWKAMRGHSNMNAALDDFITYHTFKNPVSLRAIEKFDGNYK